MFFQKVGKALSHPNRLGRKSTWNKFGKKAVDTLAKMGRKSNDRLKFLDRYGQRLKGASVLAGPYKPLVDAGVAVLHAGAEVSTLARKDINKAAGTRRKPGEPKHSRPRPSAASLLL